MHAGDRFGGLSKRSSIIIGAAIIIGLVHHTDHVLRVDHSGWPFRPDVNPFTVSMAGSTSMSCCVLLIVSATIFASRLNGGARPRLIRPSRTGYTLEMFKSIAPNKMRPGSKFGRAITWR